MGRPPSKAIERTAPCLCEGMKYFPSVGVGNAFYVPPLIAPLCGLEKETL